MRVLCLCLSLMLVGCSDGTPKDTAIQEYEAALHIHRLNLDLLDEMRDIGGDSKKIKEQERRVENSKVLIRKAEKRLNISPN